MAEPTPADPTFADTFERLRVERGLTPAQLARELGEYEGNISRWRRGKPIDLVKVLKVADYFGVDRDWLSRLAGYGDSDSALTKDSLDDERQLWRARYDHVMEQKVPRWAWEAYIAACEALADAYERIHPAALNTESGDALKRGAGNSEQGPADPQGGSLGIRYPFGQEDSQAEKRHRVTAPSLAGATS